MKDIIFYGLLAVALLSIILGVVTFQVNTTQSSNFSAIAAIALGLSEIFLYFDMQPEDFPLIMKIFIIITSIGLIVGGILGLLVS